MNSKIMSKNFSIAITVLRSGLPLLAFVPPDLGASTPSSDPPPFSRQEVAACLPKGPASCFRQLYYDDNWPGRTLADLPRKLTRSDPVELAEFVGRQGLILLVMSILPRGDRSKGQQQAFTKINPMLARLADGKDVFYLDICEKHFRGNSRVDPVSLSNLIHPTAKGYEIWAEAMEPILKKLRDEH